MILYLTKKECLEIINCLDFYSRIYIGQYDQIESDYRIYLYNKNYSKHEEVRRKLLLDIRDIIIHEISRYGYHGSYGIWNERVNPKAVVAYDMQQIIRYEIYWHSNDDRKYFDLWSYTPILKGYLPKIEFKFIKEDLFYLEAVEKCIHIIQDSLINRIAFYKKDLVSLFSYFSDDKDALAIAKEIESILPRKIITYKDTKDTLNKIEKQISNIN